MNRRATLSLICGCLFLGCILSVEAHQEQPLSESFLIKILESIPQTFQSAPSELGQKLTLACEQLAETGVFTQQFETDQAGREVVVGLQASIERAIIDEHQDCSNMFWIIHTPMIATPLVTPDDGNALSRSHIIHRFLKQGGSVMTVYQSDRREGMNGRSPEEIARFESLKAQYPSQLIEYPVDPGYLPDGQFPIDMSGATYWIQETPDQFFEMSLQATQINQPCDNCEWGIWLQSSESPNEAVSARLASVYDFLASVGYNPEEEDLLD